MNKTIAKVNILVESDTVKHLKIFRKISSEIPISLLILSSRYSFCRQVFSENFFGIYIGIYLVFWYLYPRDTNQLF